MLATGQPCPLPAPSGSKPQRLQPELPQSWLPHTRTHDGHNVLLHSCKAPTGRAEGSGLLAGSFPAQERRPSHAHRSLGTGACSAPLIHYRPPLCLNIRTLTLSLLAPAKPADCKMLVLL